MANKYSVEPAKLCDAFIIAHNMREVDKQEIWASCKSRPLEALVKAIKISSECRVGKANGEIICIFGVAPHTMVSDQGSIWMLGTNLLPKHSLKFLKECSNEVVDISAGFSIIENWCDARNKITLRWLKWLGFTIEEAKPYGVYEMPFHHFYKQVA